MANHGIINRSGRAISMDTLRPAIMKTLNTSYTLTLNTTKGVEKLFGKSIIDLGYVYYRNDNAGCEINLVLTWILHSFEQRSEQARRHRT